MNGVSWDLETGERLEDEWERDNLYAPVEGPFRPLPEVPDAPLTEDQKEYGKLQIDVCRQILDSLEDKHRIERLST